MEFRFLKGDWEFGKYKLQYKETYMSDFIDVPTVEEKKEPLTGEEKRPRIIQVKFWDCLECNRVIGTDYCSSCGAKRPEVPAKKKLADLMKLTRSGFGKGNGDVYWGTQANAVIDYVIEKYEEWNSRDKISDGEFQEYLRREAL